MTTVSGRYRTRIGSRFHAGAAWSVEGTNFSVYSHDAINMELRLYAAANSIEPFQVVALDPDTQRTFFAWHVFVEQLPLGAYKGRMEPGGRC